MATKQQGMQRQNILYIFYRSVIKLKTCKCFLGGTSDFDDFFNKL